MKIVSVVGARPQFVKLGPVSRALRAMGWTEAVLHTGQHYDFELSQAFFEELRLPAPDVNLNVGSSTPSHQIGQIVSGIADYLAQAKPDMTLVFGDTTSTLAGAVASKFANIPVAHVEAGMRSYNRTMPEELSRVATDHLSDLLLTSCPSANRNLEREGIDRAVFAGDVMYDVIREQRAHVDDPARLAKFGVTPGDFVLATIHRASNTDDTTRLAALLSMLASLPVPVIFPMHPRTRRAAERAGLAELTKRGSLRAIEPTPYLDTIALAAAARRVFTDSGGLQKEAFWVRTPCTTLREETEWVETVELGWNVLVGTDIDAARETMRNPEPAEPAAEPYGEGDAGARIARAITDWFAASAAPRA